MNRLVGALVFVALLFCVLLAVVRLRQGFGWVDAAISAATLGVAALPEEFPVALTFFLGVGVVRLARRKAMVRRAVSVENIGRVTCVCSDKTGTLTEGKLRAVEWIPVDGVQAHRLLQIAALASRPETGDPLDVALAETAKRENAQLAALIPLSGQPLLYLPIHVVWLELILHPTAMLAFQAPARADRLERLPQSTRTRFFTVPEWIAIGLSGAMIFGPIVFGYWRSLGPGGGAAHGRALVMLFLVLTSALSSSLLSRWRTRAAWIIPLTSVALSTVLLETPLSRVLFLQPPHLDDWLYALIGALVAAIPVAVWRRPRRAPGDALTSAGTGFAPPAAPPVRRAEG